ncbi:MAG: DUF2865 domain-containing protein [Xanthobacteraceae bacterium]|nr:DUF2865 domain-containing protein [Xanthobacteraceae bacterium]
MVNRHGVAKARSLGRALGLLAIVTVMTNTTPAAAGLFDFLFGGFLAPPPATPRPSVGTTAAYCVRLCDGRYFPVRGDATSKTVCNGLCPAAKTKVFTGSEIAQATADDGSTYQKLPNAFAYRERIVPDCSCNGRNSFGTASMKLEDDPTLQPGDLIATNHGVVSFQAWRKANAYTPIDRKGVDSKLIIMTSGREPVPAARPQRRAPLRKAAGVPAPMPVSHQWW